jgi:pyruvate dehydrogenase E1 component alpha subunit
VVRNKVNVCETDYFQVMDEKGNVDSKLVPSFSTTQIKNLYEWMVITRTFDDKAIALQRQGRMFTYASMFGQEASIIGAAYALETKDFVFPAFRESGMFLLRGVPASQVYAYWAGDERGMKIPKDVNVFPIAVPVGTQMLHAVGYAWGAKMNKKKIVTLTYFGDGATSEGDFHEAMNFAGVMQTPTVFVCMNNQYAISIPRENQTHSKTIAQKACAYGFEGVQVDGNDIFAVYKAVKEAVEKARKGEGPTLIECVTYRLSDHTTADAAVKYRDQKEVKEMMKKEPILRLRNYMKKKKMWTADYEKKVKAKATKLIEDAVTAFEKNPSPKKEEFFKHIYQSMTPRLLAQLEDAKQQEDVGEKWGQ